MNIFSLIQEINHKRIIKIIREQGPISRVDISELTGITRPTVTRITDALIKENLIQECGSVHSARGRRPVLLRFNATTFYSVGIHLGRPSIQVALTDLNGNIISLKMKTVSNTEDFDYIINSVKRMIADVIQESGIDPALLLGIGVGVPGPVNETKDGLISPPNFYNRNNIPLRAMLQESYDLPVIIDRMANVAAIAEKWFGKGVGYNNFVYIMADVGIGSGIIINGNLYRGVNGEAGDIGHTTVDLHGELCACGKYGCLETVVSIPRIVREVKRKLGNDDQDSDKQLNLQKNVLDELTFENIMLALNQGSDAIKEVMQDVGENLGIGAANMIEFLDPEIIIVGGRLGMSSPILIDSAQNRIRSYVLGRSGRETPVVSSELNNAVVLGAAALVIDDTFSFFTVF
ncbi:ROK family transcriptional regulator [Paenibacillus sp. HB172176]|uniref:ROK family transcriptional regulator n=1 Tax=Paenibacillus sp. HB172176 TaxID=2493690 RepID=UPI00143B7284|nr:ROK family transcriptional regulator [Paenibacillus sp. HB172176]